MYNPTTHRLVITRDIIWLCRMYYTAPQDIELTMEPIIAMEVFAPIESKVEIDAQDPETKAKEGFTAQGARVTGLESAESDTKDESKSDTPNVTFGQAEGTEADPDDDDGFHVTTRSGRVSRPPQLLEAGGAKLLPAELNYYAALAAANCGEIQAANCGEMQAVGAGIGGGFEHTSELKVMKYEEALASPDKEGWKAEIKNEHRRMQKHGVWKAVKRKTRSRRRTRRRCFGTWLIRTG